jgi:hypothetical protein
MVLPGQGIDAILRMNWLRNYRVVLNLMKRIVELKLPFLRIGCLSLCLQFSPYQSLLMPKLLLILPLFLWFVRFWVSFLKIYLGYH